MKSSEKTPVRDSWDTYFTEICKVVASRSTCLRGPDGLGVGCVLVKDRQILATGYAGSLPGQPHCTEAGHDMRKMTYADGSSSEHCCRTTHAEANAIAFSANRGIALDGATAYVTMMPCEVCLKLLLTAGIVRIVAKSGYHSQSVTISTLISVGWGAEKDNCPALAWKKA